MINAQRVTQPACMISKHVVILDSKQDKNRYRIRFIYGKEGI